MATRTTTDRVSKHQKVAIRLNEKAIRAIEPPATGYRLIADSDLRGFGIRITAAGVRSFVLTYTIDGRQRRYTIGEFPTFTSTAARKKAEDLKRGIRDGKDPLAEKEHRRDAMTFGELAELYLEKHAAKKRSGDEDRRQINVDVLPKWKHRRAEDIKRRDVIELIDGKADGGAPIGANRLLACIRKLFNWAISKDLLESSPCVQVERPGTETARTRVLSADEIRQFWERLDTPEVEQPPDAPRQGKTGDKSKRIPRLEMTPEVRAALKLILITGQRPGEVAGMRHDELDGPWWNLPAIRTKANRAHRVPLTKLALEIIAGLSQTGHPAAERPKPLNGLSDAAVPNGTPYLFPSPRGDKPIQPNALGVALRRNRKYLGLEPFSPHDLRRTCSDWMARLGVDGRHRSAVLNHQLEGVTEVNYTVYSFDAEKRAALAKWEKKLRAILSGKPAAKVVSIG